VKYWVDYPASRDMEFERRFPFFSKTLKGPYNRGVNFLVGRLLLMFFAFNITKSPVSISGCGVAFWT